MIEWYFNINDDLFMGKFTSKTIKGGALALEQKGFKSIFTDDCAPEVMVLKIDENSYITASVYGSVEPPVHSVSKVPPKEQIIDNFHSLRIRKIEEIFVFADCKKSLYTRDNKFCGFDKPKPAAFYANMSARFLHKLIKTGLYVYDSREKGLKND
jgi:hypothetical protein